METIRRPVALALAALAAAPALGGSVLRVDSRSDPGLPHDGRSWATAFLHPQDAMDAASPGDEVWVAEGRYAPRGEEVARLAEGVRLLGGFAGSEARREERDPARRRTVLDGQGRARHVVVAASESRLDGFVILGGRAAGLGESGRGGGVLASGVSDFGVEGCVLAENAARYGGGMCFRKARRCSVRGCVFAANAGLEGGAVHVDGASPTIADCVFRANSADDGGAVYCAGGSPRIERCRFRRNEARCSGGAVFADAGSELEARRSDFSANAAGFGGGVYAWSSAPSFAGCAFEANAAAFEGGGLRAGAGSAVAIRDCVFDANAALFGKAYSTDKRARVSATGCAFTKEAARAVKASVPTAPAPRGEIYIVSVARPRRSR